MAKTIITGANLRTFTAPGSMGVVNDIRYICCVWPKLDKPTALFAPGSSGIRVLSIGPARNVVFPDDTVFEEIALDALYPAELAVKQAFPNIAGLKNLTPEQSAIWIAAYDTAAAALPPTATKLTTPEAHFLREIVADKPAVAMLTKQEAVDLCKGIVDEVALKSGKEFFDEAGAKVVVGGAK